MDKHEHTFVLLGDVESYDGAKRPLYWCRQCGAVIERFSQQVAEIVPEWAVERLAEAKVIDGSISYKGPKWKIVDGVGRKSLGRGLSDLMKSAPENSHLKKVFGFHEDKKPKSDS